MRTRLALLGMVAALGFPLWLHEGKDSPSLRLFIHRGPDEAYEEIEDGGGVLTGAAISHVSPGGHLSFVSTVCVADGVMLSLEMHLVHLPQDNSAELVMTASDKNWQA